MKNLRKLLREKYSLKSHILLEAQDKNTLAGGVGEIKSVFYALYPNDTIETDAAGIQAFKDKMKDVVGFAAAFSKATDKGNNMTMMNDSGYDADSRKNAKGLLAYYEGALSASEIVLKGEAVGADSNQGDIEVTKDGKKTPWSIKVGKSQAGQQNLGASDVISMDATLAKKALVAPIVAELTGLELAAIQDFRTIHVAPELTDENKKDHEFPKGAADVKYKVDGKKLHLNYAAVGQELTTAAGKAFGTALQTAVVTKPAIATKIIEKIKDNSGVGSEKGLSTLILSPSAADKLILNKDDVTTTTSLYPGLSKYITDKEPKDKLVIYTTEGESSFRIAYATEDGDKAICSISPSRNSTQGNVYNLRLQGRPIDNLTGYTKAIAPTEAEEKVVKGINLENKHSWGKLMIENAGILEPGEEIQVETDEEDEGSTESASSSSRTEKLEEKYSLRHQLLR